MLTKKEKIFLDEYIINNRLKDAALVAQMSLSKARDLLALEDAREYLQNAKVSLTSKGTPVTTPIADAEEILQFYTRIMRDTKVNITSRIRCAESLATFYDVNGEGAASLRVAQANGVNFNKLTEHELKEIAGVIEIEE